MEKVEEKILEELDVKTMLTKIRDSYDLVTQLINKQYKDLLKFNKSRIIDVKTSGEDSASSSDLTDTDSADEETNFKLGVN